MTDIGTHVKTYRVPKPIPAPDIVVPERVAEPELVPEREPVPVKVRR